MSPLPLRVAIVGAGLMGRIHASSARACGARIVAVSDGDSERARNLAKSVGARSVDAEELFAGGVADAVHVCTPPASHAIDCERALRAGMHVLCEKPVTRTAGELESLFAVAQQNDLLLCPVHQFPLQRGVRRITANRDRIGKVRHISAEICTAGADGRTADERHWIALDILPHPLSLCAAILTGTLDHVEWSVKVASAGEMSVTGLSSDTLITFVISTRGRPTSNALRVIGDAGSATADLFHGYSYIEQGRVSRMRKFTRPFTSSGMAFGHAALNGLRRAIEGETSFPGLRDLTAGFYDSIARRSLPPVTPDECLDIARARDTIIGLSLDGLSRVQSRFAGAASR